MALGWQDSSHQSKTDSNVPLAQPSQVIEGKQALRRTGFLLAAQEDTALEEGREGSWSSEVWVGGEARP